MFCMATTLYIYTNSTEAIHASISERWTQTDYTVKVCFSVTVKKGLRGDVKTENTLHQQMQFCFHTTQSPQSNITFKKVLFY